MLIPGESGTCMTGFRRESRCYRVVHRGLAGVSAPITGVRRESAAGFGGSCNGARREFYRGPEREVFRKLSG